MIHKITDKLSIDVQGNHAIPIVNNKPFHFANRHHAFKFSFAKCKKIKINISTISIPYDILSTGVNIELALQNGDYTVLKYWY